MGSILFKIFIEAVDIQALLPSSPDILPEPCNIHHSLSTGRCGGEQGFCPALHPCHLSLPSKRVHRKGHRPAEPHISLPCPRAAAAGFPRTWWPPSGGSSIVSPLPQPPDASLTFLLLAQDEPHHFVHLSWYQALGKHGAQQLGHKEQWHGPDTPGRAGVSLYLCLRW